MLCQITKIVSKLPLVYSLIFIASASLEIFEIFSHHSLLCCWTKLASIFELRCVIIGKELNLKVLESRDQRYAISNRTAAKNDVSLGRKKRSIDGHHFSFHVLLPILNSDRAPRRELDDDGRLHRTSFCPCDAREASCRSSLLKLIGILCKNSASPYPKARGFHIMVTSVKIPFKLRGTLLLPFPKIHIWKFPIH